MISEKHEIIGITSHTNTEQAFEEIKMDWYTPSEINLPNIDVFINTASMSNPYSLRNNLTNGLDSNSKSLICILDSLKRIRSNPYVINLGSVSELDNSSGYISELSSPNPQTFYEVFKLFNLSLLKQAKMEGIISNYIHLRLSNVYGFKLASTKTQRSYLDKMIFNGAKGLDLEIYGSGEYLRDFLYIEDLISLFHAIINNKLLLTKNEYNIGSYKSYTFKYALEQIVDCAKENNIVAPRVLYKEFPIESYSYEKRQTTLEESTIMSEISWKPYISLEKGIELALLSYIK